jgi:hypothetical protein
LFFFCGAGAGPKTRGITHTPTMLSSRARQLLQRSYGKISSPVPRRMLLTKACISPHAGRRDRFLCFVFSRISRLDINLKKYVLAYCVVLN